MIQLKRLRAMAREALEQYQLALRCGGEPSYPQWADDILLVCNEAEVSMLLRKYGKPRSASAALSMHQAN